jgi:hypothetical protein
LATSIDWPNTDGTESTTPATGWDSSLTITGVAPATITCTIIIDP